jgi:3-hydroxyisobutyrate dehydrogenase-like beta-hydroxyacid dehydrogenase
MKERIGLLGLGIMGAPMAMNVAKAGYPLKHMAKDLKFVVDTAYENNVLVPSAHTMLHLYTSGVARQWGDLDLAAVLKVLQHLNPGPLRTRSSCLGTGSGASVSLFGRD